MPGYQGLLQHVVPFMLVVCRVGGLFMFAPLLSSSMIPARLRALMVIMLSAAMYPLLPAGAAARTDFGVFELGGVVVGEALIGAVIGVIASIPLMGLEMAGTISGHQVGFGLARVYNPELDADTDLFGQMLFYLGSGAFLAMNGVEAMFTGVASTFARVPVGGIGGADVPLKLFLGVLTSGFELGMRVGAPVTGIVLLLVIAFAAIGKTMPQINIMSVGFTIKVLAALAIIAAAAHAVSAAAGDEISQAMTAVLSWAEGLGSRVGT